MKKVRRFNGEDGSMVSGLYGDEANERFAKLMNDAKAEEAPAEAEPAPENTRVQPDFDRFSGPAAKPQNFKSAFADARSAGSKTFEFGGKKYTTELAKPSAPSAPSAPAAAPKADTPKADTPVERGLPAKSSKEQSLAVAQIPLDDKRTPVKGESASGSELGRNVSNTLSALPISRGIQAVQSGAKLAGRKAVEEFVKKDPNWRNKELEILKDISKPLALPKPTPRLGYDKAGAKAGAKAAERSGRAAEQRSEMLKENLKRYGMTERTSPDAISAVRENLGMGRGFKVMNKGGSVKGYASGGSVSSASKRADGCAIRGKTRA